jgi:chemotaxis protein MotB
MLDAEARTGDAAAGRGAPPWTLTLADLMSLLLACFVLLFATAETDARRFREVTSSLNQAFGPPRAGDAGAAPADRAAAAASSAHEKLLAGLGRALAELGISDAVEVEREPQGFRLRARAALFFLPGSSELAPGALAVLDEVGELAGALRGEVEVTGHPDSAARGDDPDPHGLALASARALAAARYLIEIGAVPPQRIAAIARAESDAFASAAGVAAEPPPLEFRFRRAP